MEEIIHEQKFEFIDNLDFGKAIEALKRGHLVTRKVWLDKGFVVKQIPATIGEEIIPKMQSLPYDAKTHLLDTTKSISYRNQLLYVVNGIADNYIPTVEDLFAEDWEIIVIE